MGFKIDPNNKDYKIFRLKLAAEQVKSCHILPSIFLNLIAPDPGLIQERPDPNVYRCRKCRRIVASKSNLITHIQMSQENVHESPVSRGKEDSITKQILSNGIELGTENEVIEKFAIATLNEKSSLSKEQDPVLHESQICTRTFFVEPMNWMLKEVTNNVEGKLYCPSCKSKIGSFNWAMSSKCPCGKKIWPAFYLVPSKIEFSNVVQNIKQVTV